MPTVREATFDLFRKLGMTTIFGNPGSTELPMLADYPDDFEYVLGLQEAAVVGMADGHAQVTGKPTLVNLHTAPGLGNAVGALFNAQANHSPVVVTVGQQVRAQVTMQANLTNRDAIRVGDPFVKYSYEPARAEDVPLAIAHAIHLASLPPMGPVVVSIPMDDWDVEMNAAEAQHVIDRAVVGRSGADPPAPKTCRWRSPTRFTSR
ncbi:MAG TPA: thiamine pyrophosphate-binding protein, partial [Solirubrobacterales bacterium]|nr:thiamine pyrophosphate-binding protein [Solirubrobacterales bacterium]